MPENIDKKTNAGIEPVDDKELFYQKRRKEFADFLDEKRTSNLTCPICSSSGRFEYIGFKDEIPTLPLNTIGRYFPIHVISCDNCGYIFSFMDKAYQKTEEDEK